MSQNSPAPSGGGSADSTHFWTKVGGAAGVVGVVVAVIFGVVAQCTSSDSPSTSPTSSINSPGPGPSVLPTTTAPPPLAYRQNLKLANVEGIDLDTGQVHDQNVLGVDMSPSRTADSLNAMTHGAARFAIPRDDAGSGRDRCTAIPPAAWTKTLDNMYHLPAGSHLCVQTDQGNVADLTLTHIPSAGEQYLEFDFTTWRTG
ncbi:hypothetical protein [Nocardia iowensis]|uniref:Uncharacterized protein n=1 Tax=Nocardia iowensis TaxID=204891 RepID=A0ABX8S005_NOCIO|nr:hypothetical protein [Nocardia iowensis]QXN93950.1 hypothetical protein KV110_13330 [Nocardia iowensis]